MVETPNYNIGVDSLTELADCMSGYMETILGKDHSIKAGIYVSPSGAKHGEILVQGKKGSSGVVDQLYLVFPCMGRNYLAGALTEEGQKLMDGLEGFLIYGGFTGERIKIGPQVKLPLGWQVKLKDPDKLGYGSRARMAAANFISDLVEALTPGGA